MKSESGLMLELDFNKRKAYSHYTQRPRIPLSSLTDIAVKKDTHHGSGLFRNLVYLKSGFMLCSVRTPTTERLRNVATQRSNPPADVAGKKVGFSCGSFSPVANLIWSLQCASLFYRHDSSFPLAVAFE